MTDWRVPTARRCQGCGATLGEPAAGTTLVTCQFCGLAHDATATFPALTSAPTGSQRSRSANRLIVAVVLVVVALIVASAMVPALLGLWIAKTAIEHTTPDLTARLDDAKKPIPPGDLASAPQGGGWKVLATTPPEGGFADFDPVASLPWAMAIGRAWASDAVLTRIDVGRVSATGVVDLGGEAGSGYRFVSPGRHQRRIGDADAGGRSLTATGLMLEIKGTQVRALPHEERAVAGVPAPASLPLVEILERARGGRDFEDKPYYSGYLIHLPREGWVWYFRALAGTTGYPRVRASDGRVYPYR
jgi:hypothetical protein